MPDVSPSAPAPVPAPAPGPPLAPTPLGKPVIDIKVPEPEPAPPRTLRMHEGFYLRLSAGGLWGGTSVASDSPSHPNYTVDGWGFSFDGMVGGTVSGSLAVGGAISGQGFGFGGGGSGSGTAGLLTLGAFVDGFPMPNDGLHLGGMVGLSRSSTSSHLGYEGFTGWGPGMAMWFGYDGWVADDWSMGGMLKLSGGLAWGTSDQSGHDVGLSASTYQITLLFSVLYH